VAAAEAEAAAAAANSKTDILKRLGSESYLHDYHNIWFNFTAISQ
jgi:hypothetical protein